MRGVMFGDIHTGDTWGVTMTDKDIDTPDVKTNYVSVDGRDGDLDLTEALTGDVRYSTRKASFSFMLTDGTYEDREELLTAIIQHVHGHRLTIVDDDDKEHYLTGRCEVKSCDRNRAYATISIEATCDPWRYNRRETVRVETLTGSDQVVRCVNKGSKRVIPNITISGFATITINGISTNISSSGVYSSGDWLLSSGVNDIKVKGSGSIVISYREAVI